MPFLAPAFTIRGHLRIRDELIGVGAFGLLSSVLSDMSKNVLICWPSGEIFLKKANCLCRISLQRAGVFVILSNGYVFFAGRGRLRHGRRVWSEAKGETVKKVRKNKKLTKFEKIKIFAKLKRPERLPELFLAALMVLGVLAAVWIVH